MLNIKICLLSLINPYVLDEETKCEIKRLDPFSNQYFIQTRYYKARKTSFKESFNWRMTTTSKFKDKKIDTEFHFSEEVFRALYFSKTLTII